MARFVQTVHTNELILKANTCYLYIIALIHAQLFITLGNLISICCSILKA